MIVWDLCSGLGGWSEAFVRAGVQVIRIENNKLLADVPHTYCLDVLEFEDWINIFPEPDIILASPPCLEFSNAFSAPRPKARREGEEFEPNLEILRACMKIIRRKDPTWWIVENVAGARKDFTEELGMPVRQILGPFFLWGVFPYLPLHDFEHRKADLPDKKGPLRGNYRAIIPFELSLELLNTWRHQPALLEWS